LYSSCYCSAKHGTVGVTHFDFDKSDVLPKAQALINRGIAKCFTTRLVEDAAIKVLNTGQRGLLRITNLHFIKNRICVCC
jgi:hypothetical protein